MKMKNALTLNENRDFLRLYRKGGSLVSPLLVTYAKRNGYKNRRRIGITATKKVGGAVQRNRAKRLIRAAWREAEPNVPYGWDFVFVARGKTTGARMQQVRAVMSDHLRRLTSGQQPKNDRPPKKSDQSNEKR